MGFGGWTCKHRTAGESERGLPVLDKIPGPGQRYEDQNKIKIGELVSVVVLLKKESRDWSQAIESGKAHWPKSSLYLVSPMGERDMNEAG